MFSTALYAVNFGERFDESVDCFAGFATKLGLKEIVLMHVIDINKLQHSLYSRYNKEDEGRIKEIAERKLEKIKKDIEKYNIRVTHKIRVGDIADEIVNGANEWNADFIVLDKKTSGKIQSFVAFYGSPIYEILVKSNKPILIAKRNLKYFSNLSKNNNEGNFDCKNLLDNVLFATDFSDSSLKAVPFLNHISLGIKKMTLLTVSEKKTIDNLNEKYSNTFGSEIAGKFENIMQNFEYKFTKEKSNLETVIKNGVPCIEINDFIIQTRKTLLVIGFKGRDKENLKEIFLGSVAERMISALPCSIFIVK